MSLNVQVVHAANSATVATLNSNGGQLNRTNSATRPELHLCGTADVDDRTKKFAFPSCSAVFADEDHMVIAVPTNFPPCCGGVGVLEAGLAAQMLQQ